jgi:hypothetical protein
VVFYLVNLFLDSTTDVDFNNPAGELFVDCGLA